MTKKKKTLLEKLQALKAGGQLKSKKVKVLAVTAVIGAIAAYLVGDQSLPEVLELIYTIVMPLAVGA